MQDKVVLPQAFFLPRSTFTSLFGRLLQLPFTLAVIFSSVVKEPFFPGQVVMQVFVEKEKGKLCWMQSMNKGPVSLM